MQNCHASYLEDHVLRVPHSQVVLLKHHGLYRTESVSDNPVIGIMSNVPRRLIYSGSIELAH